MPDESQRYEVDDSDELSFYQIAMASSKEPNIEVKEVERGFRVDGTLYRPVEDDNKASESGEADEPKVVS